MAKGKTKAATDAEPEAENAAVHWPAHKVFMRPVADLIPYARNARQHSEAQVAQIAASMQEFGWTIPCLIDERDGLIAGHGRIMAARKLGIDQVPVMVAKGWSEAKKRAYVIADNKLALNADWDRDVLSLELGDLDALGFDLALTGFGGDELAGLMNLGNPGLTDPERAPQNRLLLFQYPRLEHLSGSNAHRQEQG